MYTNNSRKFGIEIEVNADYDSPLIDRAILALNEAGIVCIKPDYTHRHYESWKCVSDASCGSEFVSPPLLGEDGLNQIRLVMRILRETGLQCDESCGMHVHHDVHDLDQIHLKELMSFVTRWEPLLDRFHPQSRWDGTYCKRLRLPGSNREWSTHQALRMNPADYQNATVSQPYGEYRYSKVNFRSLDRHGTVEFRQASGTLNDDFAVFWVILTQNIVNYVADHDIKRKNTPVLYLKNFRDIIGCTGKFVQDEPARFCADYMLRVWKSKGLTILTLLDEHHPD
jgi:hypothetical protein